jgi:hypothetical protein
LSAGRLYDTALPSSRSKLLRLLQVFGGVKTSGVMIVSSRR